VSEQAWQWFEEANAQQAAEIRTQGDQGIAKGKEAMTDATEPAGSEADPDILDLAGIQVTMTLEQLLRLVPRFRDGIRCTLEGTTPVPAPAAQPTEVDERIMDCECPSMEAIVGG
jgi:hypothetical protein